MSKAWDRPVLRAALCWPLLMLLESAQGLLRVAFVAPMLGDLQARQLATFTGSILILLATWFILPWLRATNLRSQLAAGTVWVLLTLVFEIAAGRAAGSSWDRIFSDFNVPAGGLLPFGLLLMLLAPALVARLQKRAAEVR